MTPNTMPNINRLSFLNGTASEFVEFDIFKFAIDVRYPYLLKYVSVNATQYDAAGTIHLSLKS